MVRAVAILFLLVLFASSAQAEKRVALVIGNSAYQHTPQLDNPKNDAADIAAVLKKHGFEVTEGVDLDKAAFDRKVRDFAATLAASEVGVFFYAGHGLQVAGQNYLVPIDAQLSTASALEFEMVRLDLVHRVMEREARTNILFIDACRNNPLARNLERAMGTRSTEIGRGLAAVEAGAGTLISFSTQPGNVALDGTGRNSPFASALVKHASTSNDDLGAILIAVRNDVMKETRRKQVPWEHSALTGRVYFSPKAAEPPRDLQVELAFWASVKDSADPAVLGTYLQRFPNGEFAAVARALVEHYERQERAGLAAREEARKREEEARKAAQVKRIEEEQRASEAAAAADRNRAKEISSAEAKRLEERQRAELLARNQELQKALEEARKAREDAKAAETQRLAALKAAEQATKAAEDAIAKKRQEEKGGDPAKLAALPKVEAPRSLGTFDGAWTVVWTRGACTLTGGGTYRLSITNGSVGGKATSGKVSASGSASWMISAVTDSAPVRYQGTFRGNTASGTFARTDGKCSGTFSATRS